MKGVWVTNTNIGPTSVLSQVEATVATGREKVKICYDAVEDEEIRPSHLNMIIS